MTDGETESKVTNSDILHSFAVLLQNLMSANAASNDPPSTPNSGASGLTNTLSTSVSGQLFGRYEALLRLASGGMGHVLVGRVRSERGVQRLVAIKTILAHLIDNDLYLKLFIREAEIASRLHHPNVVPVLELGRTETEHFLVMEYFPSVPLHTVLRECLRKRKPMPSDVACAIVADAAAGLHAAHELTDETGTPLNLVHRDATPSNLLVGSDGSVKLTDFGVAKATGAQFENMTVGGDLRGKLGYLSPEQVTGVGVDRRSDIFTLGIVLWETVAGRRLFKRDNELALLRAITEEDVPDLRDVVKDCPDAIARIAKRALSRQKEDRFQTAAEMRQALSGQLKSDTENSRSRFAKETIGDLLLDRQRQIASAMTELDSAESAARRLASANSASTSLASNTTGQHNSESISPPSVTHVAAVERKNAQNSSKTMVLGAIGLMLLGGLGAVAVKAVTHPREVAQPSDRPTSNVQPSVQSQHATTPVVPEPPAPVAVVEPTQAIDADASAAPLPVVASTDSIDTDAGATSTSGPAAAPVTGHNVRRPAHTTGSGTTHTTTTPTTTTATPERIEM